MKHNQDMLDKNGKKWKDKARIIGISMDNDEKKWIDHIN